MLGQSKIQILISARDDASKVLKNMRGNMKKVDKEMGTMRKNLNKWGKVGLAAGGAMAVGIGYKAVKAATSFEAGMSNVATILDTTTENMDAMGKKVKEISRRVPVEIADLTTALYNVRSAGISAADAMDVLETSGKLAVAGLSTTEEAVDLLTSAINVYGDETHDANRLANIMFKTVKYGKTTVAELAQGFGKVAAIAKETGISVEDLSAATAVLTTGGIKAAEAQTALKAMISNVLKPTKDAEDASERLGISFDLTALQADGLSGMLKEIAEKAGDDKQALADLFGSVEAANAIFALTSKEGGAALDKILKDLESDTNALTEGFEKQTETAEKQYLMLKNNLNVALIDLGNKILPPLVDIIKQLPGWLESVNYWWNRWTDSLAQVYLGIWKIEEGLKGIGRSARGAFDKVGGILSGGWQAGENILGYAGQHGLDMEVNKPTMFLAGERGKEQVTITPEGKSSGNTYNFNFEGAVIGNVEEFKRQIIDLINRDNELNVLAGV